MNATGGIQQSDLDEFEYADGGFNAKQFDERGNESPGDFGTVTNSYTRDARRIFLNAGVRVNPWLRAQAGLSHSSVRYHDPEFSVPPDEGDYNAWLLTMRLGREGRVDPATQAGAFGAMGRIFGLGMAGVKESLTPLPSAERSANLQLSVERAQTWLGSDAEFTKVMLTADQATLFRYRSTLRFSLKGAWGDDLPASQQLATGQRGIMTGVYAREFRGDTLAAGSAVFTQPSFRNMVGFLTTEVFGDYAWCAAGDEQWRKEGAGFNLFYRFWRFPLPLGGGLTYCFDDSDWQFSFAVGGMF